MFLTSPASFAAAAASHSATPLPFLPSSSSAAASRPLRAASRLSSSPPSTTSPVDGSAHHLRQSNSIDRRPLLADDAAPSSSSAAAASAASPVTLTAIITVRRKRLQPPNEAVLDQIDAVSDSAGQKITLQLVSADVDPGTGVGKRSRKAALQGWSEKAGIQADKVQYVVEFTVNRGFGKPAAILIENHHQNEFFVETIALKGWPSGTVYFPCYSWVQPKHRSSHGRRQPERVFFSNEVSLPQSTPPGLQDLRKLDTASRRGDGKGTRQTWENVYEYDVYNDVGNPDKGADLARPVLGGNADCPYPRRCRTGRPATETDPRAEKPLEMGTNYYVPRDEAFHDLKQETFIGNTLKGLVHQMVPSVSNSLIEDHGDFQCFHAIDRLYQEGIKLKSFDDYLGSINRDIVKRLPIAETVKKVEESANQVANILQYTEPSIISRDRFAWMRDDEFGRQAVAGTNPVQIRRMQEFPPRSALDPAVYGSPVSAIKEQHLIKHLDGLSVQQAMEEGKLFMLDYHDAYMPFVNSVNGLEGRKMYASRTILFQTAAGSLVPVAIELSLPPAKKGGKGSQRVFTPGSDAGSYWTWQLAKAHVRSNDAGFHQLVNHWLRSHAAVEPFVLASNRQLSRMHPVWKLLEPHLRYTLEINASARQLLINAGGIIENCFTVGPFALNVSAAAYAANWRFDQEALPADLIHRGMAVKDDNEASGVKLVMEDYPYAADGLLVWQAISDWVSEYVSIYYGDDRSVTQDGEIQEWWKEIREVGHGDKKDEPWWPELRTREDLKSILTTLIWIVSGFHAAVNFGQYDHVGYAPNRPCLTRRLIPEEGTPEYAVFAQNPEAFFLSTIPNQLQATTVMAVVDTLSSHSPDEEYLGQRAQTKWTADHRASDAFRRFSRRIERIELSIQQRNTDPRLKNRNGAGVLPYELLMPSSGPGKTGRGVPNSVSI